MDIAKLYSKLESEIAIQLFTNKDVEKVLAKPLQKKLKNVGMNAFLSVALLATTGIAQAGNVFNGTLGVGAITSLLTNGSKPDNLPPECQNIPGINGWKVAGASSAGAFLGKQIGNGSGNKAAIMIGGGGAGAAMYSKERDRIISDCQKIVNAKQYPRYQANPRMPQEPILYQAYAPNGQAYYVTVNNSPGLHALRGQSQGTNSVHNNPKIANALQVAHNNIAQSYRQLDKSALDFMKIAQGNNGMQMNQQNRYAATVGELQPSRNVGANYYNQARVAQNNLDRTYQDYAQKRAVFVRLLDNVAVDGYDLREFADFQRFLLPPDSVTLSYNLQGKNDPKKFAVIPR